MAAVVHWGRGLGGRLGCGLEGSHGAGCLIHDTPEVRKGSRACAHDCVGSGVRGRKVQCQITSRRAPAHIYRKNAFGHSAGQKTMWFRSLPRKAFPVEPTFRPRSLLQIAVLLGPGPLDSDLMKGRLWKYCHWTHWLWIFSKVAFLIFGLCTLELHIFDLRIGFLVKNYIFDHWKCLESEISSKMYFLYDVCLLGHGVKKSRKSCWWNCFILSPGTNLIFLEVFGWFLGIFVGSVLEVLRRCLGRFGASFGIFSEVFRILLESFWEVWGRSVGGKSR